MITRIINPTYIRELPDGSYEYGVIENRDGVQRRIVRMGEAETLDEARSHAHGCATGGFERVA